MHPLLPLLVAHLVVMFAWPFLSRKSPYRPVVFAIALACCAISFQSIDKTTWWGVDLAEYVFGYVIYMNYFLNLMRRTIPPDLDLPERLKMSLWLMFNSRVDVPDQLLPRFREGDPRYIPSRREFLLQRSWTFVWTSSALFVLHTHTLTIWPDDFESPKHQLLRRLLHVSGREWVIVLYLSFCSWFQPYFLFTAAHSLASVIIVATGGFPAEWRPLFGDLREAYTVQRFHGIFWHKLMRRSFTAHSAYFVCDILGMSRVSSVTRCAIILGSFLISGIMHALVSPMPLSCAGPRVVGFYCGLAVVVVLESVMTEICREYNLIERSGLGRYLHFAGYIWVVCFHVWTTPKVLYPGVICVRQLAMAKLGLEKD